MRDAEHLHGHAGRGGPPGQVADARGGPGEHVRASALVGGEVQPVRRAQPACGLGVGRDPRHRRRPARAAAQHLTALGHQACPLGRGQASRPDQPGDLAQAVAHRGAGCDPQRVEGAQPGERGGQPRRLGQARPGEPPEEHHHPARRPDRDVHVRIARRGSRARRQPPGRGPGPGGQLPRRGRRQRHPHRSGAIAAPRHAERQLAGQPAQVSRRERRGPLGDDLERARHHAGIRAAQREHAGEFRGTPLPLSPCRRSRRDLGQRIGGWLGPDGQRSRSRHQSRLGGPPPPSPPAAILGFAAQHEMDPLRLPQAVQVRSRPPGPPCRAS